jgi:hypothetical protein
MRYTRSRADEKLVKRANELGVSGACGTASSAPQAAPSFVASLVASEDYSNNDTVCGAAVGYCNSLNYLTPQSDAFTSATPPPVPITIVGTGFGYLPGVYVSGLGYQILPFAGPASSLVTSGGTSILRIQDLAGPDNQTPWDTAANPACQLYLANWTDSSISLDVNLPQGVTDLYGDALSPLSDFSPMTLFSPNNANGTPSQHCPVYGSDTLEITVANAQGGGTNSAGPICVLVGTPGPVTCPQ